MRRDQLAVRAATRRVVVVAASSATAASAPRRWLPRWRAARRRRDRRAGRRDRLSPARAEANSATRRFGVAPVDDDVAAHRCVAAVPDSATGRG